MTTKKYYQAHREKLLAESKVWYHENKERRQEYDRNRRQQQNEWMREYRKNNPLVRIQTHRKWKYGISKEDWEVLYQRQQGLCAICDKAVDRNKMCTDHCHTTGEVRGLLCDDCNIALGRLKDSPDILKRAIAYLEREV